MPTPVAARSTGAIRSQSAYRGFGAYPRRSIVGSPAKFVSTSPVSAVGYGYRRRYYDNFTYYPYPYPYYSYALPALPVVPLVSNYSVANPLTLFGSCSCVDGVGLTQNACGYGNVPLCSGGNQCACYNRDTGAVGCANVSGASCSPIVPSPFF
jgi:hypothetical protein